MAAGLLLIAFGIAACGPSGSSAGGPCAPGSGGASYAAPALGLLMQPDFRVVWLVPGFPADEAGVQTDDRIRTIGEIELGSDRSTAEWNQFLKSQSRMWEWRQTQVPLRLVRDGQERTMDVPLRCPKPRPRGTPVPPPDLGLDALGV
jgi:hypothetical protein